MVKRPSSLPYRAKSPPPSTPTGPNPSLPFLSFPSGPSGFKSSPVAVALGPEKPPPSSSTPTGPESPVARTRSPGSLKTGKPPRITGVCANAHLYSLDLFDSEDTISNDGSFDGVQQLKKMDMVFDKGEFAGHIDVYAASSQICPKCGDWQDERPSSEQDTQVVDASRPIRRDCYAFVCGRTKSSDGSWPLAQIWIYNKELAFAFEAFYEGHYYIDPVSFAAPFYPIIQDWAGFDNLIKGEPDLMTQALLLNLRDIIEPEIVEGLDAHKRLIETGFISYENLRLGFVPGEHVICKNDDGSVVCGILGGVTRIDITSRSLWRFEVTHFDWDGIRQVTKTEVYEVPVYGGTRRLVDLSVYPLSFHPDTDMIRTALVARGRKFESLRLGVNSMLFKGRARDPDRPEKHSDVGEYSIILNERVIIATQYYHDNEWSYPTLMHSADKLNPQDVVARCKPKAYEVGYHHCKALDAAYRCIPASTGDYCPKDSPPNTARWTDEQCLMAVPEIRCFLPSRKTWYMCKLDNLEDIAWDIEAMNMLNIETLCKTLVRSSLLNLVQETEENKNGMGRLAILLTGGTGTGKTMTVETGCEELKLVPYNFDITSVANLPSEFEREFQIALRRCEAFKMPMVIDDAHHLLAEADDGPMPSLVSTIFLQLTKDFNGIILLTSNKKQLLAPAVESRIDICLKYNDLNRCARFLTWRNKLAGERFTNEALAALAASERNGHQIESIIKLARLLIKGDDKLLTLDHIQQVMEVRMEGVTAVQREIDIGLDGVM